MAIDPKTGVDPDDYHFAREEDISPTYIRIAVTIKTRPKDLLEGNRLNELLGDTIQPGLVFGRKNEFNSGSAGSLLQLCISFDQKELFLRLLNHPNTDTRYLYGYHYSNFMYADPSFHTYQPLIQGLIANRWKDCIEALLAKGFDLNYQAWPDSEPSAVQLAIDYYYFELIPFLYENGADPNKISTVKERGYDNKLSIFELLIRKAIHTLDKEDLFNLIFKRMGEKGLDVNQTVTINRLQIPLVAYYATNYEEFILHYLNTITEIPRFNFALQIGAIAERRKFLQGRPLHQMYQPAMIQEIFTILQTAIDFLQDKERDLAPWKGWKKSDVGVFENVLQSPKDLTYCPICFQFVQHGEACMYLSHNCAQSGVYYDKFLYKKYQQNGEITWCVFCGRICKDELRERVDVNGERIREHVHYHYEHSDAYSRDMPAAIPFQANINMFNREDCYAVGGGGVIEKVRKTRALLQKAIELQGQVNQISDRVARTQLIQTAWDSAKPGAVNASGVPANRANIQAILDAKDYGLQVNGRNYKEYFPADAAAAANANEPAPVNNALNQAVYPDAVRPNAGPDFQPILHPVAEGQICSVCLENKDVWQFRHRKPDGSINTHADEYICKEDLENTIRYRVENHTDQLFGRCWNLPQCNAIFWPSELEGVIDPDLLARYKRLFNVKVAKGKLIVGGHRGGSKESQPIFTPLNQDSLVCAAEQRGGRRKKFRKTLRKKKSTKRHIKKTRSKK